MCASLQTVPVDEGTWAVPLGCAHRSQLMAPVRIADLRRSRARVPGYSLELAGRCLRVSSEDNVPHIRDRIRRSAETAGLLPYQVIVDTSGPDAVAGVLSDGDLLLCSEAEAADLDLPWVPLIDPVISRGYTLTAGSDEDIALFADFAEEFADCLGGSSLAGLRQPGSAAVRTHTTTNRAASARGSGIGRST